MSLNKNYIQTDIGKLPRDWNLDSLADHLIIKGRIGWKGLKKSEYLDKGFAIINGEQIKDDRVDWTTCGRISKERYDESPEIKLEQNDILMTKDGTIGKIAYIDKLLEPTTVASGIFVVRNNSKKLAQKFLFYYFKSHIFKHLINGRIEGSVVPHLYQRDFVDLLIPLPKIEEQHKIAEILESLEAKIELNHRMNKALEEMAQAIFKSWFVDFDPVKAKAVGRTIEGLSPEILDLFPDSFEESELGNIPTGWKIRPLSSFGNVITGNTPSKNNPEFFGDELPFLTPSDYNDDSIIITTSRSLSSSGKKAFSSRLLPKWSIATTCIGSDMGKTVIVGSEMVTNQQINSINCKKAYSIYLYLTLKNLKDYLRNLGTGGSTMPIVNKTDFSSIEVITASDLVLEPFNLATFSLFERILENLKENKILIQVKNSLLPKLISGEIRVSAAEKIVEGIL